MTVYEQELRKIVEPIHPDAAYAGRSCYVRLGENNRARLQFASMHISSQYDALKMTVLNRNEGVVDTLILRFSDLWGRKQVTNPNFREGVYPHLWDDGGRVGWYAYQPTAGDYGVLSSAVSDYLEVFMEQTQAQSRGQEWQMTMK